MTRCEEVNSGKSHNLIKVIIWISFSKSSFPSFPILPVRSLMSCILPLLFSIPVFLSLLFHFLPHMWFCSSSLCTPALPLLHCHPSLTYGFPLRVCVCLVLPRVQWGSLLTCMCVLQTTIERWRVCVCRLMGSPCVEFSRLCNSF